VAATSAAPVAATTVTPVANTAPVAATPAAQGELQIKFSADTWYEIRDRSGKVVLGGTAKAGQEVAGGGTAPYKVTIGNVKGVESMSRNGTPVDLKAANRNNVARLTLP
jgi:cytoskeleton protein RodZ